MATKKATKTAAETAPAAAKKGTKAPAKTAAKKAATESKPATAAPKHVSHEEIAKLAEQLWIERGRPHGSAHIDWHNAEQKLKG